MNNTTTSALREEVNKLKQKFAQVKRSLGHYDGGDGMVELDSELTDLKRDVNDMTVDMDVIDNRLNDLDAKVSHLTSEVENLWKAMVQNSQSPTN